MAMNVNGSLCQIMNQMLSTNNVKSVLLQVQPSVEFIYLFFYLFFYLFIYLFIHLFIYLFIYLFTYSLFKVDNNTKCPNCKNIYIM